MVRYDFSGNQVQQLHKLLNSLQQLEEKSEVVRDVLHKLIKLHETKEFQKADESLILKNLEASLSPERMQLAIRYLSELEEMKSQMIGGVFKKGELKPVASILHEKLL
jgi:hypothetical protein